MAPIMLTQMQGNKQTKPKTITFLPDNIYAYRDINEVLEKNVIHTFLSMQTIYTDRHTIQN